MGPCIKEESLQKAFLLLHNLSLTHKKWMSKPLTKSEEFPPKKYYTRQKPETDTRVSILTVSIFVDVSGRIALFCSSFTKRSSWFSGWGEKKGSDFFSLPLHNFFSLVFCPAVFFCKRKHSCYADVSTNYFTKWPMNVTLAMKKHCLH